MSGSRIEVASEQPRQLSNADTKPVGLVFDTNISGVKYAVLDDEVHCPIDGCTASFPSRAKWCGLGSTTKARPESGEFGCGGRRKEADVARERFSNRANRPAIDPRCTDPGEEASVISRVTRQTRPIAFGKIKLHRRCLP